MQKFNDYTVLTYRRSENFHVKNNWCKKFLGWYTSKFIRSANFLMVDGYNMDECWEQS